MFRLQSSVRKKVATVHLTTIPCEPNTVHMAHRMLRFCKIYPRTNNIVHAGFQGFRAFLCAFISVFAVFALCIIGKCTSRHLFAYGGFQFSFKVGQCQ